MKKIIILTFAFGLINFFAPNVYAKKFDVVTFQEVQDIRKGTANSYITKNGETFTVGGKLKIGHARRDDVYTYIIDKMMGGAVTGPLRYGGTELEVEITKISWKNSVVRVTTTKAKLDNQYPKIIIDLETALQVGEVVSKIMSRESAIAKLKEAKDLLELEIINQSEYDALRKKLALFIINK